jgi:hypothetical protein
MLFTLVLSLTLSVFLAGPVQAHRPYFEDDDIRAEAPWAVDDPTISTAIYATLESQDDVDYFTFEGLEREVILLALTIPQIAGQEDFAPTMALIGPGLPEAELPERLVMSPGTGALPFEPPLGPPPTFYEPFSRTSYWERQEARVALPAAGAYVVAVWHPEGQVGRYTIVIGEKERLGGDPAFPFKMRSYWTPVEVPSPEDVGGEPAPDLEHTPDLCGR